MYILTSSKLNIDGHVSEGPYGCIILGLIWNWYEEAKHLELDWAVIVRVDIGLKRCIDFGMYYDIYSHPFSEIYMKNGRHWFRGLPVLNYDMLDIPQTIDGIGERRDDWGWREENWHWLLPRHGKKKFTINPVCTGDKEFSETYRELYACVLSFDEKNGAAAAVGFDGLGKIQSCSGRYSYDELSKEMLDQFIARDNDEYRARRDELAFLNLFYDDGGIVYKPIWNGERPVYHRRRTRLRSLRKKRYG